MSHRTTLSALHQSPMLSVLPKVSLGEVTQLAMRLYDAPLSGITIRESDGTLISGGAGQPDLTFCRTALDGGAPLIVPDAHIDRRFAECPLVSDNPWIRFYAGSPLQMPSGEHVGVLWVADTRPRDAATFDAQPLGILARQVVTQLALHRTHALVAQREGELRSIIETSGEAIYGIDTRGRCTFVNPACLRMLGYSRAEDLLGRSMHDLVHYAYEDGAPYAEAECSLLEATRDGLPIRLQDEVFWRSDGTPMWVIFTASPLYRDEQLVGAVVNFIDVSEERHRREELVAEARGRDRFTGVLGHDLRNPLSTVLMGAQRIAESDAPEPTRRLAVRVGHAAGRMQRLVHDLLDFVRVREGGALMLARRATDFAEVAREVVEELEVSRPDRRIDLDITGDTIGEWDPDRLAQVCSNLLANAIHHGAPDEPVRLEVRSRVDDVLLTVTNAGSPIPDELRSHLFDPFRRGASVRAGGLGLGLFIVREIAVAHGGDVGFVSDENGTSFTVRLPRAA